MRNRKLKYHYRDDLILPQSPKVKRLFRSWQDGHREICISGNRGCGKTVALLLYALSFMRRIPNFRVVWARSEYSTIQTTVIQSLEHDIFKYPLGDKQNRHPKNPFYLSGGTERPRALVCDNGSSMRFLGLDTKSKTRGLAMDLGILNEGTREQSSQAWSEFIATQAAGRAGAWYVNGKPFSQIITDTNPDSPYHWIYKLFRSENPDDDDVGIYDFDDKLWLGFDNTDNALHVDENGDLNDLGYQKIDDLLRAYPPGFDRQRMAYHQWVAALGVVYSMYQPTVHEVPMSRDDFGEDTRWTAGIDFGGTSPFAFGLRAYNDGVYRTFKEVIKSQCTIDEVIQDIDALLKRYNVAKTQLKRVHCDTNVPGFTKAMRQAGYPMKEADKDILAGVDHKKTLIGNNKFFINTNSLEKRDPHYDGPQGFKEEVTVYAYLPEEEQEKSAKPNHPVPKNNHFCDESRYNLYGERSRIKTGFTVMTGSVDKKHKGW